MSQGIGYMISAIVLMVVAKLINCSEFSILYAIIIVGFINVLRAIDKLNKH